MNEALYDLITATGCKPKKGASDSSVDVAFRRFGVHGSKSLCDLFLTANGGALRRLNSHFFSLAEALDIWDQAYSELEWRVFPVFADNEHESDPVVIGLDGPLQGLVCQAKHSGDWRVLAPNLKSFLRALGKFEDKKRFFVEDHDFVYPRRLSRSEIFTVKGLVDLSYSSTARWMERSTFIELALSMVRDEDLIQILRMESHPDSNSRFLIAQRLKNVPGVVAKKAVVKICQR